MGGDLASNHPCFLSLSKHEVCVLDTMPTLLYLGSLGPSFYKTDRSMKSIDESLKKKAQTNTSSPRANGPLTYACMAHPSCAASHACGHGRRSGLADKENTASKGKGKGGCANKISAIAHSPRLHYTKSKRWANMPLDSRS
jgi:hypothetical protein